MKLIIIAGLCLLWAHDSLQHNHEGHFMAYKFGLHPKEEDGLLHKRQVGLGYVRKVAAAVILSAVDQTEIGRIDLHYNGHETIISGRVQGLKPGLHGFHIHEKGDLSNKCAGAGGHFNPEKRNHGGPSDSNRHVGDLGNIEACDNGVADVQISDRLVTLEGEHNVIGRAIVVHADPDDLGRGGHEDSLTTGHAGARVACGIIHEARY